MSVPQTTQSKYGTLGMDIGVVGRWLRLVSGLVILVPLGMDIIQGVDGSAASLAFSGYIALYFIAIVVAYTGVYGLLGERLARMNPWVNTLIFVGSAWLVALWDLLVRPWTGVDLPTALTAAMALYVGLSLLLQWRIQYGGCEVVSIPILLFRRRYPSYCIPLVAVDAVEKAVIDRNPRAEPGFSSEGHESKYQ